MFECVARPHAGGAGRSAKKWIHSPIVTAVPPFPNFRSWRVLGFDRKHVHRERWKLGKVAKEDDEGGRVTVPKEGSGRRRSGDD